jgi:8-amino-7-oxononanoate synthase
MAPPETVSRKADAGDTNHLDKALEMELGELAACGRLRATLPYGGTDRARPTDQSGRALLSFCSNDYLGLAGHPGLVEALARSAAAEGVGSGAARLISGESSSHLTLEAALAAYVGRPAALLFPAGYMANVGVISALAGPTDLIASDAANHASIIDGCRLSRARVIVYPHLDADRAATALATAGNFRRRLLITESLFSMDGDRAPLGQLAACAQRMGALFLVDEAHALGTAGPSGGGLAAAAGVVPDVLVGTLGKALGTFGGFAAGSTTLRRFLVNRARTFVFATAPPSPLAAATLAALTIAAGPEGEARRTRAHDNARRLRQSLATAGFSIPGEDLILPLTIGEDSAAVRFANRLRERGFVVPAIRPPTVPAGTARLRITVSAAHSPADIDALVAAIGAAATPGEF